MLFNFAHLTHWKLRCRHQNTVGEEVDDSHLPRLIFSDFLATYIELHAVHPYFPTQGIHIVYRLLRKVEEDCAVRCWKINAKDAMSEYDSKELTNSNLRTRSLLNPALLKVTKHFCQ